VYRSTWLVDAANSLPVTARIMKSTFGP